MNEESVSYWNKFLVALCLICPITFFIFKSWNTSYLSYSSLLGLIILVWIGFSAIVFIEPYEPKHKNEIYFGYGLLFFSLGFCYIVGKTIYLPLFLEIASFSTIFIYSRSELGVKQALSVSTHILVSGVAVVFITAWIFLPMGDTLGLIFLSIGLLIKSGFSGFHLWLPKVNEGGPGHALGVFTGILEILPLILFYQFVSPNNLPKLFYQILFVFAALGVFFGGITSFFHKNTKIALAYSSIESVNFLWLCLIISGLFYNDTDPSLLDLSFSFKILFFIGLINHAFSKTFQLYTFGLLEKLSKIADLDSLKGQGKYLGISSLFMGIGTFSYAVLPGTLGFLLEATYFYLNSKILDMPIGKSIFLLPSMIFIFFGIVLGGFSHLKLYLSVFLSNPTIAEKPRILKESERNWIKVSLGSLASVIVGFPIIFPLIFESLLVMKGMNSNLVLWFRLVSIISIFTIIFVLVQAYVSRKKESKSEKKLSWDCGSGYVGGELSIPSTMFSEPLRNSLGRYFITKSGESKVDSFYLKGITYFFHKIGYILSESNNSKDEDVSHYLAFSSVFLLVIFAILLFGDIWGI